MGSIGSTGEPPALERLARSPGIVVAGVKSPRTHAVLSALAGVPNVVWQTSHDAALHCATTGDPACIIIADELDSGHALDLLICVRQREPAVAIYFVTDAGNIGDAVAGMRGGATTVVETPQSLQLLRHYVLGAVRQGRSGP